MQFEGEVAEDGRREGIPLSTVARSEEGLC